MSLRDSRDNATVALWRWDDAVDRADAEAEAEELAAIEAEKVARTERVRAWRRRSLAIGRKGGPPLDG